MQPEEPQPPPSGAPAAGLSNAPIDVGWGGLANCGCIVLLILGVVFLIALGMCGPRR